MASLYPHRCLCPARRGSLGRGQPQPFSLSLGYRRSAPGYESMALYLHLPIVYRRRLAPASHAPNCSTGHPASIVKCVRRRAIREATRTRHVRRTAQSYVLLEERPRHPGLSRLRVLRTLIRRVVDRAPIYVDRDLSKEPGASHAKIVAPSERCPSSPAPIPHQPRTAPSLFVAPRREFHRLPPLLIARPQRKCAAWLAPSPWPRTRRPSPIFLYAHR